MRTNRTRAKLLGGHTVVGATVAVDSPRVVETLAALGFDYVTIDLEHEPSDELALVHSIRAAEAFDITPIVRLPNDRDLILRVLGSGAQGIHIPRVNSADDVQQVVDAVRFYPLGKRTFYSTARDGRYGVGIDERDYVVHARNEVLIVAQIEEKEGIGNIGSIVEVPSLDAVQFGPKDLRQSLGFASDDLVWQEIEVAARKVVSAGLWLSMVAWIGADPNATRVAAYGQLGVRMITGQSREFLIRGAKDFQKLARTAIGQVASESRL
jgi:2-keto-3-deoxy-L-rhamnonate aldolase RhmA